MRIIEILTSQDAIIQIGRRFKLELQVYSFRAQMPKEMISKMIRAKGEGLFMPSDRE